jgi:hypothetical protein
MRPHGKISARVLSMREMRGLASLTANACSPPRNGGRLLPAPRQKQPQISPIFKTDTVTLHVSREKDKEIALVNAGWDDTKVVHPNGCGQARRTSQRGSYPRQGGAMTPPSKTRTPLRPPWFFTSYRCRSRASNRAFFALVFEVALRVTAPPLCVTGPPQEGGRLYLEPRPADQHCQGATRRQGE